MTTGPEECGEGRNVPTPGGSERPITVSRDELERVLSICRDAADMVCECSGYYKCGTCPDRIACRADDAVDVLVEMLASEAPDA